MAILPEKIDCVVAEAGNPVMGLMLRAEFKTAQKNPYTIVFGPTNREGHACLDRATINQQTDSQLNLSLMDFEPLDKVFTGVVRVAVMQERDVQDALRAYDLFKGVANFSDHYEDDLKWALVVLRHLDTHKVDVRTNVEPATVTILLA